MYRLDLCAFLQLLDSEDGRVVVLQQHCHLERRRLQCNTRISYTLMSGHPEQAVRLLIVNSKTKI